MAIAIAFFVPASTSCCTYVLRFARWLSLTHFELAEKSLQLGAKTLATVWEMRLCYCV